MAFNIDDLELGLMFASSGFSDNKAYLDKQTEKFFFIGSDIDETPPSDLGDNENYILMPSKQDLGLGKPLAVNFAESFLPEKIDEVYSIFSRKGAYARFKDFLITHDLLEDWYQYENERTRQELMNWCSLNGINVSDNKD